MPCMLHMIYWCNMHYSLLVESLFHYNVHLWPPYVIGPAIIYFHPVVSFYVSFFISSPNLSGQRLDVYHTSTHGVALVRI